MDYLIKESTLTGFADAIREKTGGTENLTTEGIKTGIGEVYDKGFADGKAQGGGGGGSTTAVPMKDVNFYDYDGTRLYSYTVAEAQALSELPPLPTREGLTCQGWNYDLATIKAHNRAVDVGATYITDDGKTRLYITIAAEGRMDVPLYFSQTVANGVTIDWGDGSTTETLTGTGNVNTTHTYASVGDYVISLAVAEGCTLDFGRGSSSYCVMGMTVNNGVVYTSMLRKVEIGDGVTSIGEYSFYSCYSLENVSIPNSVTSIGSYAFYSCYSLVNVLIPNGVTSIGASVFSSCYSLVNVSIPESVTSIGASAFAECYGMKFYDFTSHTSIPTLSGTNAFNNIPSDCEIRVPANLYDLWIKATNWSSLVDKIVAV